MAKQGLDRGGLPGQGRHESWCTATCSQDRTRKLRLTVELPPPEVHIFSIDQHRGIRFSRKREDDVMLVETGAFGGASLPDGSFSEVFAARVVIPDTDFPGLGIGRHEPPGRLPACFRWCFDSLGIGGTLWSVMLRGEDHAEVYFARIQDAVAFVGRWSAEAALARQPVPVP
jgi:hypothetical protein